MTTDGTTTPGDEGPTESGSATTAEPTSGDDGRGTTTAGDGDAATTAPPPDVELDVRWEAPYGTVRNQHHHLGTDVIVGTPRGSFARLSRADGSVVWERSVPGDHGESWTTSALADGRVLFGGGTTFYAVDAETGEMAWQTDVPTQESPSEGTATECVASGGVAMFGFDYELSDGTDRAGLAGVDVATGDLRWQRPHDDMADAFDSWLGVQSLSPAIEGRTVVSGWNNTFWVDIGTGEIGDGTFAAARYDSVRSGDHLYLTRTGNLHAFRITDGTLGEAWTFEPFGRASSAPSVADGTAYFAADDNGLYAVRNGEKQWRAQTSETIRTAPAVTDSWVWAGRSSLSVVDRGTGRKTTSNVDVRPNVLSGHGDTAFVSGAQRTVAYRVRE